MAYCVYCEHLLLQNHKMKLTKFEIRALLKHYWKQDYPTAATAARKICDVEEEGVVSERVAQRWCQHFDTGEENTEELPHSGRRKLCSIENKFRVLEENPRKKSTYRLSEELGETKNITHRHIKTLGKLYGSCRSALHELTPQQAQRRADICRQLVDNPMDDRYCISGELSHVMKNGPITATLTPRNSGSVPINLPKSS